MSTIIGIDVGKSGGYAVRKDGNFIECEPFPFVSLVDVYNKFKELIRVYKPDIIITGKPNRMYNIILRHAQFIGVISLLGEKNNISVVMVNDTTVRAKIMGKGNGFNKVGLHELMKGETQDVSDSMSFALYQDVMSNE